MTCPNWSRSQIRFLRRCAIHMGSPRPTSDLRGCMQPIKLKERGPRDPAYYEALAAGGMHALPVMWRFLEIVKFSDCRPTLRTKRASKTTSALLGANAL